MQTYQTSIRQVVAIDTPESPHYNSNVIDLYTFSFTSNMTENIPPNAPAANADATRGVPYYEKLKRDLREIIQKKRLLDKNMVGRKP